LILFLIAILSAYLVFIARNPQALIGVWPLEGIFWETTATILVITLLSYMLFRNLASVIVASIIQVFTVVILPVLRYPNTLNLIGPWDSVAHYSFAKWIVVNGYVDTAGNLYYSKGYGFHPGNGIIPAILNLLSSISLGWSMNIILMSVFSGYILILIATLESLGFLRQERTGGFNNIFWLVAILTVSIFLYVYYGGGELGYGYTGYILYVLVRQLFNKGGTFNRNILVTLIIFFGLLITHLATAVIVISYMLVIASISSIATSVFKNLKIKETFRRVMSLIILSLFVFIFYEVFIDVLLFGSTLSHAIQTIYSFYVQEIMLASRGSEVMGMSFIDLLLYLTSTYAKVIVILGVILIHTIFLVLKKKALNVNETYLTLILLASYPTWLIGWAGIGSLMSGMRSLVIISFLLALNIAITYEKLYGFVVKKKNTLIVLFLLIVLGFASNFGLPFEPIIRAGKDAYTYPTFSQGGFSDYALHPITYVSSNIGSSAFLCLQPYTTFGLCDLMWHTTRIPEHGHISPKVTSPDSIIELIEKCLGSRVIIPQPMRDQLLPGPIGYDSLFDNPFHFLLENGKGLVYNNGMYALFLV